MVLLSRFESVMQEAKAARQHRVRHYQNVKAEKNKEIVEMANFFEANESVFTPPRRSKRA